jgi:integrase
VKGYRTKRTRQPGLYKTPSTRTFPEGAWEVRYRDAFNGTRRKIFRTKQEALDFQSSVRTDKRRGDWIDPRKGATRFRDVAEAWYETTASLRPTTRSGYRSMLNVYLLPRLGDHPVAKITPSVVRTFLAGLPTELSGTRKRHILRVLSPILNLAVEDGLIRSNPCRTQAVRRSIPKPQRTEMPVLTAQQVHELAEAITPRYRTLLYFAAYTGCRAGEIAALRVKSLDLLRGRVRVEDSVSDVNGVLHFGPPKNGKPRTIAVPRFLVELLAEQATGKGRDGFVFAGEQGKVLRHANMYARHFKPAVRRALPDHLHGMRFHDLRHTAAALLIANGEHPKAISERLGHSSIAITMDRYGHLFPDHEDEIIKRLDETFRTAASAPVAPLGGVAAIR